MLSSCLRFKIKLLSATLIPFSSVTIISLSGKLMAYTLPCKATDAFCWWGPPRTVSTKPNFLVGPNVWTHGTLSIIEDIGFTFHLFLPFLTVLLFSVANPIPYKNPPSQTLKSSWQKDFLWCPFWVFQIWHRGEEEAVKDLTKLLQALWHTLDMHT